MTNDNDLVGTYSWAHGAPPEVIQAGDAPVLRVEAAHHRVIGITSDLHFFRCSLGVWKRDAIPATAEDWQRAILKTERRTLQQP